MVELQREGEGKRAATTGARVLPERKRILEHAGGRGGQQRGENRDEGGTERSNGIMLSAVGRWPGRRGRRRGWREARRKR
jgi:hypothetical protein